MTMDWAIISAFKSFLCDFAYAFYSIDNPVERLERHFDLVTDKEWYVSITLHTYDWDVYLGSTHDIDLADLQSTINWLKTKAANVLRLQYWFDA